MKSERGKVESLCMRSSIIYIELGKDSKILEILDIEGIKSVLRILTQTEGCIFVQNRTRMIEITLANLDVLIQAKYLFEKLNIPTKDIRKDFSGGQRYRHLHSGQSGSSQKFKLGYGGNTSSHPVSLFSAAEGNR